MNHITDVADFEEAIKYVQLLLTSLPPVDSSAHRMAFELANLRCLACIRTGDDNHLNDSITEFRAPTSAGVRDGCGAPKDTHRECLVCLVVRPGRHDLVAAGRDGGRVAGAPSRPDARRRQVAEWVECQGPNVRVARSEERRDIHVLMTILIT